MSVSFTLHWWMAVPALVTLGWLWFFLWEGDEGMAGACVTGWLAMIVPALLVAWLK